MGLAFLYPFSCMSFRLPSLRSAACLLALTALAACSKSNPAPFTDMAWTVDGNNVTATSTRKEITGNTVEIVGSYTTSRTASTGVDIKGLPLAVGTYSIIAPTGGANELFAAYVDVNLSSTTSNGYFSTGGTVTVSSVSSSNITGTFSYVAEDVSSGSTAAPKTITNGKFNMAL
jgi:hypothetical protein